MKHKISGPKNKKAKAKKYVKKGMYGGAKIEIEETFIYIFLGVITFSIIAYFVYYSNEKSTAEKKELELKIAEVNKQLNELSLETNNRNNQGNGAIFSGNQLENPALPDRQGGVPINIRTRGEPEPYSQVGYLFIDNPVTTAPTAPPTQITTNTNTINLTTNVNTGNNNSVLPLYGRRIYRGSDKWNYYVLNENYNQVRLPLTIDGKDSMEEYGVKELYDNDTVFIPSQGKTYTVKIYEKTEYRYIPY